MYFCFCRLVTKLCTNLCDPMDCSMTHFPGLQYIPGVCSNSYSLHQWCYPTISSSVTPFSSNPQCFPGSGSFPMSWLFALGAQSIRASASPSVLPMNIQGWSPLGLIDLSSCCLKTSQDSSPTSQFRKHCCCGAHPVLWSNSHIYTWLLEKQ